MGKLKELDDYMPSDPALPSANAKLLNHLQSLQAQGVRMKIERLH